MKRRTIPRARPYAGAHEEQARQIVFLGACFWLMVLAYMVLRDPAWRLLHAERLIQAPGSIAQGWTEMTPRTLRKLAAAPRPTPAADAVATLENALHAEVERRRAGARAGAGGAPRSPRLLAVARSMAALRARSPDPMRPPPELADPQAYLALQHPSVLVRTVEVHQRLPALAPAVAAEVVAGWMNDIRFASTLAEAGDLQAAVGVVRDGAGVSIQALLVERLVPLSAAVPPLARRGDRLVLRGPRGADSATLFLKRPSDPGFHPLPAGGSGGVFSVTVPLPGPGVYAVRAAVRDRLSDPLPVVVR